jgi:hypothetical protein
VQEEVDQAEGVGRSRSTRLLSASCGGPTLRFASTISREVAYEQSFILDTWKIYYSILAPLLVSTSLSLSLSISMYIYIERMKSDEWAQAFPCRENLVETRLYSSQQHLLHLVSCPACGDSVARPLGLGLRFSSPGKKRDTSHT